MYQYLRWIFPVAALSFPALVCAAPWSTDLEEDMASLPWVVTGDILVADSGGVTVVVTESFIGDNMPEDTLFLDYWEMGSWMSEVLSPSEGVLLIPDSTGSLQVSGTPGQGFWLLRGYFDFNAFWVFPGVISREELILLCSGDTLPDRRVEADIRFAGMSDFIPLGFQQTGESWVTDSYGGRRAPGSLRQGNRIQPGCLQCTGLSHRSDDIGHSGAEGLCGRNSGTTTSGAGR